MLGKKNGKLRKKPRKQRQMWQRKPITHVVENKKAEERKLACRGRASDVPLYLSA